MKQEFLDAKEGLTFTVFDKDPGPLSDDALGHVKVSAEDLCNGDGERMVLKLQSERKLNGDFGTISIRCRPASNYDKKFLDFAENQNGDFLGVRQSQEICFDTKGGTTKNPLSKLSMKESSGPDAGVKKVRNRLILYSSFASSP